MSNRIVEHHIKYIETHGYDETVFITDTEHQNIDHRKLFPMVSSKELAKISRNAFKRTEKGKKWKVDRIRNEIILVFRADLKEAVQNKAII